MYKSIISLYTNNKQLESKILQKNTICFTTEDIHMASKTGKDVQDY